jgi:hypothetical protein
MTTTASEYVTPPILNGLNNPTNTVTGAASTAAVPLLQNGYMSFVPTDTAAWIVFGASDVAAASASNGWAMPVGVVQNFKIEGSVTHFRVIATGAGTLSWYKSGP